MIRSVIIGCVMWLAAWPALAEENLPPGVALGRCAVAHEACYNICRVRFADRTSTADRGLVVCAEACFGERRKCESAVGDPTRTIDKQRGAVPPVRPVSR